MSQTLELGTPTINPYGTQGFISAVLADPSNLMTIGAGGLQRVHAQYEVCWEDGRIATLPDSILQAFVKRAQDAQLPKVEDIEAQRAAIAVLQAEGHRKAKIEADERGQASLRFRAEAEVKTPDWAKAVIVAELVEDKSDTMSDYHGSSSKRTVILAFSTHKRDLFSEMRKAAATFGETAHLATAPDSAEHRQKYSMGGGYFLKDGSRHASGWKVQKYSLYQGAKSVPEGEWHLAAPAAAPAAKRAAAPAPAPVEAAPVAAAAPASEGMRIEEHMHTKKGFQMHICILSARVEREEFDRLNAAAKALGGWYSRPWGKTPGGFAFKSRAAAEEFAASNGGPSDPQPDSTPDPSPTRPKDKGEASAAAARGAPAPVATPSGNAALAERFRLMADRLQGEIDHKMGDRLANTPKRQREAGSARIEGWRLMRTQTALFALAAHHEAGTVLPALESIKSKAQVYELTRSKIDHSRGGYYDAGIDTDTPALDTDAARAIWALLGKKSDAERAAEALRSKVADLQFANIPGYFPTPQAVSAQMIDAAKIPDGPCRILEPSAGSGHIVDEVKVSAPEAEVHAYERHSSLREVLTLKGHQLVGSDFLDASPDPIYDRVLMNPPFENGQDAEHIMRAACFLKPGGRLVAIMSPGPFFRQDRKAAAFREWFTSLNGERVDLPEGSFKESGTGVATLMVVIEF